MDRQRRKRLIDLVLIAGVFVPWVAIFVLHIQVTMQHGFAQPGFNVAGSSLPGGAPRVTSLRREWNVASDAIRVGDRILKIGDRDLHGVGHIGFDAAALHAANGRDSVPATIEREGEQRQVFVEFARTKYPWMRSLANGITALVALLVLLRAPPSAAPRSLFAAFMALAITQTAFHGPAEWQTWLSRWIFYLGNPIAITLIARWALRFPPEARPWPAHVYWLPWLLLPLGFLARLDYLIGTLFPPDWTPRLVAGLDALIIAGCIGIVTTNSIRADGLGRRRAKWVLWGAWVGLAPGFLVSLANSLSDAPWLQLDYSIVFGIGALWPLSFLVAITRQHLFDIDRLLSATASLTLLATFLLSAVLTFVPWFANQLQLQFGLSAGTSEVALTFLLVAVSARAQKRVRPLLEERLFPERQVVEQGVRALVARLDSAESAKKMLETTCETLSESFQPDSSVIYQSSGDSFAPVVLFGHAPGPSIGREGPVVAMLANRSDAIFAAQRSSLRPLERALLDELNAAVVCPIRIGDDLHGFLCLGPKRSGDEFTPVDIGWIQRACEAVGQELRVREAEKTLEEGRRLQERYREFVPGPVANQLESGSLPEATELEVSVLFTDLRGYSAWAEQRRPDEVFDVVNRYTEAVTRVVRENGGSVVEFNGDGIMAIFGAPHPIDRKERAALLAAHEIPEALGGLGLDVAVGIATGPAYVGSIRGADRQIWSALGATTNLASRLQSMTRDLGAAALIDGPTYDNSGAIARFLRPLGPLRVRGFQERVEVYALGRPASDAELSSGSSSGRSATLGV